MNTKINNRKRRRAKIRARIHGSAERPRLSVFKSNTNLHIQLVNDDENMTITGLFTGTLKGKTPMERAKEAGKEVAKLAKANKIKKVVFDRGGFAYTGHMKAFAESARDSGLEF